MILIADSGSTKTDWRIISEDGIEQYQSQGLNPVYKSKQVIHQEITQCFKLDEEGAQLKNTIKEVFFYGAGCMAFEKGEHVKEVLAELFPNAHVFVYSDILAAARATSKNEKGIVAILGTGANVCLYNGDDIEQMTSGLGFILGDEGSGGHLGKTFIKAYLDKEFSNDLEERISKKIKLSKAEIIDKVYRQPNPNVFLAQFSKYMFQIKKEPQIEALIIQCFEAFFEKHVITFPNYNSYKLSIVGSVGFYFSDYIRKIAAKYNVTIGTIIEKPIAGLTLFHQENKLF